MPFSKETLDFLFENHLHDSRQWFLEHKASYQQHVIRPLQELTSALAPHMMKIDADFVTIPRIDKTICRIWRDTRYSKDPSLYRDTMWIIFKRDRMHSTDYPGFYFEITGNGFNYGCGFYHASTAYMNSLRRKALDKDPAFLKAQQAYLGQTIFEIEGDTYKRPHYPDQPDELRQWLERRNIGFSADSHDFGLLFSPKLAGELVKGFHILGPIYHFLLDTALEELQNAAAKNRIQRG